MIELNNGMSISKASNISSFFPENWSEDRILKEVAYAANHLVGMHPAYKNAYIGEAQSGIQIVFFCDEKIIEGEITIKKIRSFFPLYENLTKFEPLK